MRLGQVRLDESAGQPGREKTSASTEPDLAPIGYLRLPIISHPVGHLVAHASAAHLGASASTGSVPWGSHQNS